MNKHVSLFLLVWVSTLVPPSTQAEQGDWITLFDGKSLKGWSVKSGFATYRVEDGAIVGKTAAGSGNSFLCTERQFGEFELEFEVKVDDGLNSGVQVRSMLKNVDKKNAYGGRVYGPQVEIESGPGQAGFVYGEATGLGWISPEPKAKDRAVSQHEFFKNGKWNHFRVVAQGPHIKVWLNRQSIADLTHEEIYKSHPKGLIGLQVHGIKKGAGPYEVRWRNLRIRRLKQPQE